MAISETLDQLSCELLGEVFDQLASGTTFSVVASVCDANAVRTTCAFEDDFQDVCLERAREWVKTGAHEENSQAGEPICYAICYCGAVGDEENSEDLSDAVLLEFGEKGSACGWSAFSYIDGVGKGEDFRYTDPEPAGETECLL